MLRQRCIIYRRWWTQAASDGTEQRRRAAPFSFVGLFPVGRLCAGWMAAFEETQAAIELRVKAGRDSPSLRHSNTTVTQCLSLPRPERKRKRQKEREWQRTGEIVGVFDFDRKGRGECFFVVREEKIRKKWKKWVEKKTWWQGKRWEKGRGGRDRSSLQCSAALIYVYSWFCIIHKISWCNPVPRGGNGSPPSIHSVTTQFSSEPQQQVGDGCTVSGTLRSSALLKAGAHEELDAVCSQSECLRKHKTLIQSGSKKQHERSKNQQPSASI